MSLLTTQVIVVVFLFQRESEGGEERMAAPRLVGVTLEGLANVEHGVAMTRDPVVLDLGEYDQ